MGSSWWIVSVLATHMLLPSGEVHPVSYEIVPYWTLVEKSALLHSDVTGWSNRLTPAVKSLSSCRCVCSDAAWRLCSKQQQLGSSASRDSLEPREKWLSQVLQTIHTWKNRLLGGCRLLSGRHLGSSQTISMDQVRALRTLVETRHCNGSRLPIPGPAEQEWITEDCMSWCGNRIII